MILLVETLAYDYMIHRRRRSFYFAERRYEIRFQTDEVFALYRRLDRLPVGSVFSDRRCVEPMAYCRRGTVNRFHAKTDLSHWMKSVTLNCRFCETTFSV